MIKEGEYSIKMRLTSSLSASPHEVIGYQIRATISKNKGYNVKLTKLDHIQLHIEKYWKFHIPVTPVTLNVNKATIIHFFKEANKGADLMANKGHKHSKDLIVRENALKKMKMLLLTDLSSIAYEWS